MFDYDGPHQEMGGDAAAKKLREDQVERFVALEV